MATADRPKLPRATLRDGKLYVEGEKEPYFQDREHTVRLPVGALKILRGYEPRDLSNRTDSKVLTESLHGTAKLEDDRFAVIGLETDRTTPIKFHLRSIADTETKFNWHANIGFHVYNWEFPEWGEYFWIQGYCTRQYLDDLLTAVRKAWSSRPWFDNNARAFLGCNDRFFFCAHGRRRGDRISGASSSRGSGVRPRRTIAQGHVAGVIFPAYAQSTRQEPKHARQHPLFEPRPPAEAAARPSLRCLNQGAGRRELSAEQPALQRPLCPRLAEISGDLAHFTRLAPFARCNSPSTQM
jgi:hypothetical protein